MLGAGALFTACLLLNACATTPDAPESQIPRVDCRQHDTAPAPDWPVLWWFDGPSYAIRLLGLITEERALRGKEHDCIEQLRQKGLIR